MPKYHINKKGSVSICKAIFKKCPLSTGHHFNTQEEANDFIEQWDKNRIQYEDLAMEKITDPINKGIIKFEEFLDQNAKFTKCDNSEIQLKDFKGNSLIVLDDGKSIYNVRNDVEERIKIPKIKRKYIGKAIEKMKDYNFYNDNIENAFRDLFFNIEIPDSIGTTTRREKRLPSSSKILIEDVYDIIVQKEGIEKTLDIFGYNLDKVKYKTSPLILLTRRTPIELFPDETKAFYS